ncbi:MAG: type pilus assembly PilZ [Hyphomicrobiales bacterium]|nr:type pilus assembly PilZ [Hyphomicrobiales bacterium]
MFDIAFDTDKSLDMQAAPASESSSVDGGLLFEALVCDLHWTMLHIGTLAGLSTACVETKATWTLRPWRHLTHDSAAIVHLALRYHPQLGLSSTLAQEITAFEGTLSGLKTLTRPLMAEKQTYTASQRLALAPIATKWRELCRGGAHVLQSLQSPVTQQLFIAYALDGRMLTDFLREAAAGHTQRVSPWGEITLPTLKQRRRTARAVVERACRLILPDGDVRASLLDVSGDGVGISCKKQLTNGQMIDIDVGANRLLQAKVVRCDGETYGLRLTTPLRRDDPLFGISRAG